jgi:hypothetical protein
LVETLAPLLLLAQCPRVAAEDKKVNFKIEKQIMLTSKIGNKESARACLPYLVFLLIVLSMNRKLPRRKHVWCECEYTFMA